MINEREEPIYVNKLTYESYSMIKQQSKGPDDFEYADLDVVKRIRNYNFHSNTYNHVETIIIPFQVSEDLIIYDKKLFFIKNQICCVNESSDKYGLFQVSISYADKHKDKVIYYKNRFYVVSAFINKPHINEMPKIDFSYELEETTMYDVNKLLNDIPFDRFFKKFNKKSFELLKKREVQDLGAFTFVNYPDKFTFNDKTLDIYHINEENYIKTTNASYSSLEKSDKMLVRLKSLYQILYQDYSIKIDCVIYTMFTSNATFSYNMLESAEIIPLVLIVNENIYD